MTAATDTVQPAAAPYPPAAAGWYLVGVLTLAYVFSFIDRSILTLLVVPIKADLGLSDTQISLLHGLAFALFYTAMGIPIASLADRKNRRNLIVAGVAFWSLATAACGLARGFWQLFLARVGVGVGEAALSPAAYSMIADSFPEERLGRALGTYTMGAIAGAGLALVIGGAVIGLVVQSGDVTLPLVGTLRPWQLVFFIVGLPGLLVAAWIWTLREPVRRALPGAPSPAGVGPLWQWMRAHPGAYVAHLAGFALLGIVLNALVAWTPAHLFRNFGLKPAEVGLYLGGLILVFGTAGVVIGGWYGDRLRQRGRVDAMLRVGVISAAGTVPFGFAGPLLPDLGLLLAVCAPLVFFATFAYGAAPAAIQIMTPPRTRALASAVYLFFLNLVGMGLGPLLTALVTDRVFRDELAVGKSLSAVMGVAGLLSAILLWRGLAPFRRAVTDTRGPSA